MSNPTGDPRHAVFTPEELAAAPVFVKPKPAPSFTAGELAACAQREVRQRKRVYRNLVFRARMTPDDARQEIAMMEAIAADYAARAEAEAAAGKLL